MSKEEEESLFSDVAEKKTPTIREQKCKNRYKVTEDMKQSFVGASEAINGEEAKGSTIDTMGSGRKTIMESEQISNYNVHQVDGDESYAESSMEGGARTQASMPSLSNHIRQLKETTATTKKKQFVKGNLAGPELVWTASSIGNRIIIAGEKDYWPDGWTKRVYRRANGKSKGRLDSYWYSPVMHYRLRSLPEVKAFMKIASEATGNDERKAWRVFKERKNKK
jgi:Methyl-CpG binding domain